MKMKKIHILWLAFLGLLTGCDLEQVPEDTAPKAVVFGSEKDWSFMQIRFTTSCQLQTALSVQMKWPNIQPGHWT